MGICRWVFWLLGSKGRKGVKVKNMTDNVVELQIRVGSVMVKAYTVFPHSSKNVVLGKWNPRKNPVFYEGVECEPYLWIHLHLKASPSCTSPFMSSPAIAQHQFVSLSDLSRCSSLTISSSSSSSFSILKNFN